MPPANVHVRVAEEVARALGEPPALQTYRGEYLLGCYAPDIRYLTRRPREHTHFFDLNKLEPQDSLAELFAAHPYLAEGRRLDGPTLAFMAGYISHLATDEAWICDVFRPCFGAGSPWGADPFVQALDRALQAELDRRERQDGPRARERQALLRTSTIQLAVSFLTTPDLERWRDLMCQTVVREPTWDTAQRFLETFLRNVLRLDGPPLAAFLEDLPQALQRTLDYVSEERLVRFQARAIGDTVAILGKYLP